MPKNFSKAIASFILKLSKNQLREYFDSKEKMDEFLVFV